MAVRSFTLNFDDLGAEPAKRLDVFRLSTLS
jgi:hypothetical protein